MPDTIPPAHCGEPARITERFWLDSTDGPIEHPKTGCPSKHWFTLRPTRSSRSRWPLRNATWRCCRADWCCRRSTEQRRSWQLGRMAGGNADVPALWGCRVSALELAVRPGRTGRLRRPT